MHSQDRSERFRGKYRIETARLKNWDYGSSGYYFVTVCVKNRECVFGNVDDNKMILSEIGKIAEKFWLEIPAHFPFVKLDEFIIMPNHIHGIIIIDNHRGVGRDVDRGRDVACNVSTASNNKIMSIISPKRGSLSTVIRSYKSNCTKTINKTHNNIYFQWQLRFYDHIIRDVKSLNNIRNYIINNPLNWDKDEENQARKIN